MNLKIFFSLCVIYLYSLPVGFSQSEAFQLNLPWEDSLVADFLEVVINEDDDAIAFFNRRDSTTYIWPEPLFVFGIPNAPGDTNGYKLTFPDAPPRVFHSYYQGDKVFFSFHQNLGPFFGNAFGCLNIKTGENWFKKGIAGIDRGPFLTVDAADNVYVGGSATGWQYYEPILNLSKLNGEGETLWQKGYRVNLPGPVNYDRVYTKRLHLDDEGNIFMDGRIYADTLNGFDIGLQFVAKFDSLGNPLKWRTITEGQFDGVSVSTDGFYLFKKALRGFKPNGGYGFVGDIHIIKLDADLNLVWGKTYHGENFYYAKADLQTTSAGNILLSYTSEGTFPAVVMELDKDGNILWQKGYPNYEPQIDILNDGSFMLSSSATFDGTGKIIPQYVFAKTDTEGNIPGCETYPTCIFVSDFSVEFGTFDMEPDDIFEIEEYEAEVEPYVFTFHEECNYPPAPQPDFNFPDTLCVGNFGKSSETYSRLANAREWHLIGPNVDSILWDALEFEYYFSEPGEYILQHTIWLMGCSYIHEKNITVLAPPEISIGPAYICPDGPYELKIESERNLKRYTWSTGDTAAYISINSPGIYSVEISDGYCVGHDTAEIKFVSDIIGTNEPIILPDDTIVCEIHLPHEIRPYSLYSDLFFSEYDNDAAPTVAIPDGLPHEIYMEAFGCLFNKEYTLKVSACEVPIYFPTIFSPNNDGINDLFFPMGVDFEPIELIIYDRWGGRRYQGQGTDVKWDGGDAHPGTYLYHFIFRNLLTGLEEKLSGEVSLIR